MASNFEFLKEQFPELYNHATYTESMAYSAPRASCFYARFTLEQAVLWLYNNDAYLRSPYDNNLGALIHEQTFKDNLKPGLFPKIRAIHKVGNLAAHSPRKITTKDSLHIIEELFHFLYWLARYYSTRSPLTPLDKGGIKFNRQLIPNLQAEQDKSQQELEQLATKLSQTEQMRSIAEKRQQQTEQELEALKAEIDRVKAQNEAVADTHDYNETDTRRYLIDIYLQEAGWDISHPDATEYKVTGMPNSSGVGYVDYVLWGDNGKPLAVIEAKKSALSPTKGKQQAKLYADCLEKEFEQRPVIFYSNGYNHWIWDDVAYPPREISGFLKKDELERIIFRRSNRKSLDIVLPNQNIAGRTYQIEALKRIGETFDNKNARKALLVMATGTGKTRTAISLVDLLMRGEWVKRVLFLADRNSLVKQAFRNFKTHLPTVTPVNLLEDKKTKDKNADSANVVLSTYPTMFNRISNHNGNEVQFSPGYFDLVIVDEAHRGIYKKYQALFEYFDSLLVGLTATPRSEVHRDTYKIFDLEAGVPTFAYELDDAIKDGYLVPSQGVRVPFKFLRQGIRYDQLSLEEQEEYEERFRDEETGEVPDEVNAAAINKWLFNKDTVNQALQLLMEKGLKVEGGDRLGKTIIFARNHEHAEFIVKQFDINYPHYKGKFAQVIDFIELRDKVRDLLSRLEEKQTIPMVKQQLPLIQEVQAETWWSDVTPAIIESIRLKFRDLVKFIDRQQQTVVYTDFQDELGEVTEVDVPIQQTGFSPYQYRKKVEAYIRANEDHIAIYKLKRNEPLTEQDLDELELMLFSAEEIESRERFEEVYGKDMSLKLFIRQIVGLDRNAAKAAFAKYLEGSNFNADQIRFVENIIDYLTQNGVMNPGLLYESPFTDIHSSGLDGVFNDEEADEIVALVRSFNETVDNPFRGVA